MIRRLSFQFALALTATVLCSSDAAFAQNIPAGNGNPVGSPYYYSGSGGYGGYGNGGHVYGSYNSFQAPANFGGYSGAALHLQPAVQFQSGAVFHHGAANYGGLNHGYGGGVPTGSYFDHHSAYQTHFGPGFYRSGEMGHVRFPHYSYRAPWYHPGPGSFNRNTNFAW